jgi:hypothetical protein
VSEHTKEPWNIFTIASPLGASYRIFSDGSEPPRDVAHIPLEWDGYEDARRIVACVNLLAGMETEQIEWMLAEKFRLFSERSDSEGNRHLKFLRNP